MHSQGGPVVKFIPTHYYTHHSDGKSRNILREVPWLVNATDGVTFYFMGMSHGQAVCGTSPLCAGSTPPVTCGFKCLFGSCAEASLPVLPAELAAFADAMPAGHELVVGLYFSGYGGCGQPSLKYLFDALRTVLATPAVSGAMVYTLEKPDAPCGAMADPGTMPASKGCIVEQVFREFSGGPS